MAKILYGNFIVDARGSINGNTYSKNKYGAYARTKVTPVNPRSTYQQDVRSSFASVSQSWRALTSGQRDQWNLAAPDFSRSNIFGNNVPLSGFNLFMRLNLNLIAVGRPTIDEPPVQDEVTASLLTSGTALAGDQEVIINFAPTPTAAGIYHQVFATAAMSAGKTFVSTQLRQIGVLAPATATANDISAIYIAKFGLVGGAGQKIFVQLIPTDGATGIPGTSSMVEITIGT